MPAYDIDGLEVVGDLDEICWSVRDAGGPWNIQRHVASEVIHKIGPWAVVLVATQDFRKKKWAPTRYVLTRYRYMAGAWRLQNHFRLHEPHLLLLAAASARFVQECEGKP